MLLGKRIQIPIIPGVNPTSDSTELDTVYFTDADKVRFQSGKLRKLLGWKRIWPTNFEVITGAIRTIFSYRDPTDNPITLFGTSTRLYVFYPNTGDHFYNITPLQTTTTTIANAFATEYNAAVNADVVTTAGSGTIRLLITNYFQENNSIQISGVTGGPYNGIPASAFNGTFPVNVIGTDEIQFTVPAVASSSGYVSVPITWAASYLYVTYTANGLPNGDRVGILGSTNVDGILAASINREHIITNIVNANTFVIQTDTFATSSVTAGGGTATTIQVQIPGGMMNQDYNYGFGAGQFGLGLFGADGFNDSNENVGYPRIWSMDDISGNVILTPGDPATDSTDNLYFWQNDVAVAPVLVSSLSGASNVPLACKWVYVGSNTAVVLGSAGYLNQFISSDIVSVSNPFPVNWSPGAATYAYSTIAAQATAFVTQAKSRNFDMLFTQDSVYTVEFVDKPDIWFFRELYKTDGIIGPHARATIEDAVFWLGQGDFYVFDGYTVNVLPNNTLKRYVFDNINWAESWKSFCFPNVEWSEVWFFYPAGQDTECNNYVIYNYKEAHWTTGTLSRSAAEERVDINVDPLLAQSEIQTSIPIGNRIQTFFFNLAADSMMATDGSNIIGIFMESPCYLASGDHIFISNASSVGGIDASFINGEQILQTSTIEGGFGSGEFGAGEFGANVPQLYDVSIEVGATATSSATGGTDAITIGTAVLGVPVEPGLVFVGDIITIAGASGIDGFTASEVNTTNPVRYIENGMLEVNVNVEHVFSTSQATGGGSGATLILPSYGIIFMHESGLNDYNYNFSPAIDLWDAQFAPMLSYAQTNYAQITEGDNTMLIYSMYPDIKMQEAMEVQINVKEYAQSARVNSYTFNMNPTMIKIDPMCIGRQRQYIWTSNVLNGNFLMGKMYEEVKESTPR